MSGRAGWQCVKPEPIDRSGLRVDARRLRAPENLTHLLDVHTLKLRVP